MNNTFIHEKYLLPEDMYISYLVDSKVYNNLFLIIGNLCYNEKFLDTYIMKKVYTGWAYYPSSKQFIKKTKSNEHQPTSLKIYLTPNPTLKGIMSTQETVSSTDLSRPDFINIFINPNIIRVLRYDIFVDFKKNSIINDRHLADEEFKRRIIGYLDHEFLHIRQIFMTTDGKSSLIHQSELKDALSNYLKNLSVNPDTKNTIERLFYYFIPTEIQARISSSARYFEDKIVRDKARQLLKDDITEQMTSLEYSLEVIRNFFNTSDILKKTSPDLMDVCIRMTYDLNRLDEINDIVRETRNNETLRNLIYTIDNDKKLNLHYFTNGLEQAIGDFKASLMNAIYGVFDRTESKTERVKINEYFKYKGCAKNMTLQFRAHCFRSLI